MPADSFADAFEDTASLYPQHALSRAPWHLEPAEVQALRAKLSSGRPSLGVYLGNATRGLTTGRNEAFVIDRITRDRIIQSDPKSAEIFKPWVEGKDIKRWRAESRDLYLILFERGWTNATFGSGDEATQWERLQATYPAICAWLYPQEDLCRKRLDKGDYWWELRACTYYDRFRKPKILSTKISSGPTFTVDRTSAFLGNTSYFMNAYGDIDFFVSILNSSVAAMLLPTLFVAKEGGFFEIQPEGLAQMPIPAASDAQKAELGHLAEAAQAAAEKRYALQQAIACRIPDLAADPANAKLTTKLKEWWTLPDFAAFQKEVEKALKARIPLAERNEWENWITTTRAEIHALTAEITRLEAEINARVYALFDLTPDEIALLEANV